MTAITTDQVAAVPASRENAEGLTKDAKREHQSVFALCSPSLFLVLLILFLPVGWLMWLSFFDVQVYRTRFLGHKFVSCGGPE